MNKTLTSIAMIAALAFGGCNNTRENNANYKPQENHRKYSVKELENLRFKSATYNDPFTGKECKIYVHYDDWTGVRTSILDSEVEN